jgi:thiamine kinase-like enzyme
MARLAIQDGLLMIERGVLKAVLSRFAAGRCLLSGDFEVHPVEAGAVNRLVRVKGSGVDWAVRIAGEQDAALQVSRKAEQTAQEGASRLGFAPELIHVESDRGILVTQWIPTSRSSEALVDTPEEMARLAARVRSLHDSAPPPGLRHINVDEVVAGYWPHDSADEPSGPVSRAVLRRLLEAAAHRRRSAKMSFCHNDLHLRNVLDDGDLWFIDWEYAGLGDPLFELAGLAGYQNLSAEQVRWLLCAYGGVTEAELRPWQLLFDVVHVLWLDRARAWESLDPAQREALLSRLAV